MKLHKEAQSITWMKPGEWRTIDLCCGCWVWGGHRGSCSGAVPPQHPSCLLVLPQSPAGLLGILPSEAAWPHGADFQQGFFSEGFCVPVFLKRSLQIIPQCSGPNLSR